ncbi:TolB family protein [Cylindrospermopsis raciborskii]|uniref:TolB family protein n=1 Tax=Cylindrospermopsis raciborskii TaxID=77022 RepID=UPI0011450575|nr:hypothetical protein [Cylindrospermopsis raciborskii]TPX27126.1 hypothetical protein FIV49_12710 [Cylindrospermopsis raciborskii GIHE 2018]
MSIFETIQLTNNSYDDEGPSISGNKVAWSQWDGSTYQVYYYDGANIIPLTDTYFGGQHVKISGDNIVWRSSGFYGVSDIYLYNGKSTIELSDNSYKTNYNGNPQISGNSVIWPSGNEIYLYNGANVIQLPKNDSEKRNTYKDVLDPQISGNNVIWSGWDGTDYEIYLYNGLIPFN